MSKRYTEFDFIRVFAALSVIAIHITSVYVYQNKYALFINQFSRYSVPLFILLSGLLLYLSHKGKELKIMNFYQKRLNKVFIPFVFWTLFYLLLSNFNAIKTGQATIQSFLILFTKGLIYGNGHAHLYFITIIVQLYLLYPALNYMINKWERLTLCISLLITSIYQTGIYLSMLGKIKLPWSPLPYYEFVPTWLFFFIFGMFVAKNISKFTDFISNKTVLLGVMWISSLILLLVDCKLTNIFESVRPSVLLYCILTFFFIYSILTNIKIHSAKIHTLIGWLSSQSFLIYFSHLFFMKVAGYTLRKLGLTAVVTGTPYLVLLFLETLLLTLIFALIVGVTPIAPFIGGFKNKINFNSSRSISK
ncbi:acyltransferase [Acetivibrio cellulolyticus]|uniref:acyltransferase n=1 Tax=Acetivibrio cellulolyticus TaxID=35830 RepID=UPI0001E2D0DA|nr:acyltransferase [Acetivibrio cellulolyticus]